MEGPLRYMQRIPTLNPSISSLKRDKVNSSSNATLKVTIEFLKEYRMYENESTANKSLLSPLSVHVAYTL